MSDSKICSIPECGNALSPRSQLGTCALCRANINTWSRRSPIEIVGRRARLIKYQRRMEEVTPTKPKARKR